MAWDRRGIPLREARTRTLPVAGNSPGGATGECNLSTLAPLREREIIRWADAFQARTARWPNRKSGPITEAPGETWLAVENALRQGLRGLPGGSSLVQLLVDAEASETRDARPVSASGRYSRGRMRFMSVLAAGRRKRRAPWKASPRSRGRRSTRPFAMGLGACAISSG